LELKIGTPATLGQGNVHSNFGFQCLFVSEFGAPVEQTDRWADKTCKAEAALGMHVCCMQRAYERMQAVVVVVDARTHVVDAGIHVGTPQAAACITLAKCSFTA